jgi:hypothetical protein
VDDRVQHKNSKKKKKKKKRDLLIPSFFFFVEFTQFGEFFFLRKPNKTRNFDSIRFSYLGKKFNLIYATIHAIAYLCYIIGLEMA